MYHLLLSVFLLIIGFVLLIKGADFFVDGSSNVAKMFKVPPIIIGLTIVAMGTSLPETAVSVTASLMNNNALAISNAIGSNIFNLLVVTGCSCLFVPMAVQIKTLKEEFPFSIFCALLLLGLGFLGMNISHLGFIEMSLSRTDGMVLLAVFACYLLWMIRSALKARNEAEENEEETLPLWKCIVFILGGAVAIKYGGDFVVEGASEIASSFGMSQNLIGLTIVALGTSLPELVTSVVAAKKNEVDMALGNVIGSNIFNILLVLGVASTISPIEFIMENVYDIIILCVMSVIVWLFAWTKRELDKKEGLLMLLMYACYMVYIFMR
ncbi:MAG: calcium/sodium antiporter [Bacillota bacterium]|nr:calcium/sodium antiporter [Bacillota bacterium]